LLDGDRQKTQSMAKAQSVAKGMPCRQFVVRSPGWR
jgi:hypothetical protein